MKYYISIYFLLVSLLVCGCAQSLKDYVAKSSNYGSRVTMTSAISVTVDNARDFHEGAGAMGVAATAANIISSAGGAVMSRDQARRISGLVDAESVASSVAGGFGDEFAGVTHLVEAGEGTRPDLSVDIRVLRYGLYAESVLSVVNFYIEAEISVFYTPELKKIYTRAVTVSEPMTNIAGDIAERSKGEIENRYGRFIRRRAGAAAADAVSGVLAVVAGAGNLQAFYALGDDDVVDIFGYMANLAGRRMARDLVDEIFR